MVDISSPPLARSASNARKAGLARRIWQARGYYLYVLPALVLLLVFSYYPFVSAFYYAFFEWNGANKQEFIGIDNFTAMFSDRILLNSFKTLGIFLAASVIKTLVPSFLIAQLIYSLRSERWQYTYRYLMALPMVIPGVIVLFLWAYTLYHPQLGFNDILRALGLEAWTQDWLRDPDTVIPALIFFGFPWVHSLGILIYLAALQNLPDSVLDAARLDGVRGLRRLWYIDIPLTLSQTRLLLIMTVLFALQDFGFQLIVTRGGPLNKTMVPPYHLFKNAFDYSKMGYASAIGVVLFLGALFVTWLSMRMIKADTDYQAD